VSAVAENRSRKETVGTATRSLYRIGTKAIIETAVGSSEGGSLVDREGRRVPGVSTAKAVREVNAR
jgi:hypothetical protein